MMAISRVRKVQLSRVWLIALLAVSGCFPPPYGSPGMFEVRTYEDEFEGFSQTFMSGNVLAGAEDDYDPMVSLDFLRWDDNEDGTHGFSITPEFRYHTWMFIEESPGLVFMLDGERLAVECSIDSSQRDVQYGGDVIEAATCPISEKELLRIAQAAEVNVRLRGSEFHVDRHFGPENQARLDEFVAAHVR